MSVIVVAFNVKWQRPTSSNGEAIREIIEREQPEVVCLTEAHTGWFGAEGYEVASVADYGLGPKGSRRKVVLWSRRPWTDVDPLGSAELPSGRFVAATTVTSGGALRICGICIPYMMALVKERAVPAWSQHQAFITALEPLARKMIERTVVLGDFNQTVPRRGRTTRNVAAALASALQGFSIATNDLCDEKGNAAIDHIAITPDLASHRPRALSRLGRDGRHLSDHFGVAIDRSPRDVSSPAPATRR